MPAYQDLENESVNHMSRAVLRGVPVGSTIDIGCSNGSWSRHARKYWPNSSSLLVDANPAHRPALEQYMLEMPRSHVKFGAAGPSVGKVKFFATSDPLSGTVSLGMPGEFEVDQFSIDAMVEESKLPPPYFLKLDTHGYELEILQGAAKTIRDTTMIQLEVYNFRLREGVPVFPEMCFHMDKLGYRLADVFQVMHRPSDGLMWQADALFESKAAPWWRNNGWP
ncbi:MAG: FkbM family methyltransferase [Phycisphaerales bacterium]|nr:FkbM family methyltransferase [Planctomycetota bacterium]